MTTPENPDRPGRAGRKPGSSELDSRIDELEHLISGTATGTDASTSQGIPILDDVVDPETMEFDDEAEDATTGPATDQPAEMHFTPEQVDKIISTMDNKLTGELDELVNILKDAIKDSIIAEVKTQLETRAGSDQPTKSDEKPGRDDQTG